MKKVPPSILEMGLLSLALLVIGCKDSINDVGSAFPSRPHSLRIVDSSFSAEVRFAENVSHPDLLLQCTLRFISDADSALIEKIAILIQQKISDTLHVNKSFKNLVMDSIRVQRIIYQPSPFVEFPKISLRIVYRTYVGQEDSLQELVVQPKVRVAWKGLVEPSLRRISLPSAIQEVHRIIWKHNNQGFYFTGSNGGLDEHTFYCSLPDYSVTDVSFRTDSYQLLDLSHDDRYFLVSDNNAQPSNIYLYDAQLNSQRLIIRAQDSLIVSSGAFSADDDKIAFATVKLASMVTEYPVFLYTRSESSLRTISEVSGLNSTTIDRWLPNSNDTFSFHDRNVWLYIFTIVRNNLSTVKFPFPHYPWSLLSDGRSIVGLYFARIENGTVNENHLFLYDTDGAVIRQITFYPEILFQYAASDDRSRIVFSGYRNNEWGLWLLPL